MAGSAPDGTSLGAGKGPAVSVPGPGTASWASTGPRGPADAALGQYQMPPWWWAGMAAERGAQAAVSLGSGWGAFARQLLGAVASVPIFSWALLLLTLYLARHVRSCTRCSWSMTRFLLCMTLCILRPHAFACTGSQYCMAYTTAV